MSTRHVSPLRYPGGKASLAGFLTDVIDLNDLRGCHYFEPYAGGAGAALTLLKAGAISRVSINDADVRVVSFWKSILNRRDRFIDHILSVPLDIREWNKQREICDRPKAHSQFAVGFAAFYMNRCNRSGVLTGAGPIGGRHQSGKWRLGVRFNREALSERILDISKMRSQIDIYGQDAIEFLKGALPRGNARKSVFVYLDPPYVKKGKRLYLNSYGHGDHGKIASYLNAQRQLPWLLSYDDDDLIRELYKDRHLFNLPIRYSLQQKRSADELIVCADRLAVPRSCCISGREAAIPKQSSYQT